MTAFDALKKNRSKSLEKLNEQLTKISAKSFSNEDDGKYWKPTRDKAGNGMAIIRFLPAPDGEDMPFVRLWNHFFQGPTGQYYVENSLSTIGKDDPLGILNQKLWATGHEDDKKTAQKQKRKLNYISNILVIKDSEKPENEGKVFLFSYGKKIFDKLNDMRNPSFEDESPVNPFDFWEGANFRLKIRTVDSYPNYDKSEFDSPGPLFKDDDKMEEVYTQLHSLTEVIDAKHFKTFDELQTKLHRVLGLDGTQKSGTARAEDEVDVELDMSNIGKTSAKEEKVKESKKAPVVESEDDEDSDEDMAFFRKLAGK